MTDVTHNSRIQRTILHLLNHYSFDSDERPMPFVVADWIGCYPWQWILDAIVEALYQGRYKTISVEQILIIWQRRGCPLHHFNGEFERIVCGQLVNVASTRDSVGNNDTPDPSATGLSEAAKTALDAGSIKNDRQPPVLAKQIAQSPIQLNQFHELDRIDNDCMGHDGRLSEMLGEETTSGAAKSLRSSHILVNVAKPSIALKQRDAEGHKVPVAVFEPLGKAHAQPVEWQQLTETTIRHHPIHQFTPIKASPMMYQKLKAIARNHSRTLTLN